MVTFRSFIFQFLTDFMEFALVSFTFESEQNFHFQSQGKYEWQYDRFESDIFCNKLYLGLSRVCILSIQIKEHTWQGMKKSRRSVYSIRPNCVNRVEQPRRAPQKIVTLYKF